MFRYRICILPTPRTWPLKFFFFFLPRRTLRSRGASTVLPRTSAVELLRGVRASEHARRRLLTTERDGHLLGSVGPTRFLQSRSLGRESSTSGSEAIDAKLSCKPHQYIILIPSLSHQVSESKILPRESSIPGTRNRNSIPGVLEESSIRAGNERRSHGLHFVLVRFDESFPSVCGLLRETKLGRATISARYQGLTKPEQFCERGLKPRVLSSASQSLICENYSCGAEIVRNRQILRSTRTLFGRL